MGAAAGDDGDEIHVYLPEDTATLPPSELRALPANLLAETESQPGAGGGERGEGGERRGGGAAERERTP